MMQATEPAAKVETATAPFIPQIRKSCLKCAHIRVCAIFRAIDPLLNQSFTEATRPFRTEELARAHAKPSLQAFSSLFLQVSSL